MKNIWDSLQKPFFILAPMEDVTDTVFRRVITSVGRPDLYFTEFTSSEGMLSEGEEHVIHRLSYEPEERPLIAQIWGIHPESFYEASKRIQEMGFDGIDINMGCPVRSVIKQGACSALIRNHSLAKEIIQATKEGGRGIPVSVKTRIGFNTIQTEEWIPFLLEQDIAALTIHARTVKELSKVPAHWEEVQKAVDIRDQMKVKTRIIGNGDVLSKSDGIKKCNDTGCDGIMVGRGIFHNPWMFGHQKEEGVTLQMRLDLLEHHVRLFDEKWKDKKKFQVLKKYFKIYISGFEGASDLRKNLMESDSSVDVFRVLKSYRQNLGT